MTAIDTYIQGFTGEIKGKLVILRKTIREELPSEVEETISYGIPTFKLNGKYVVYLAGFKNHISIYPLLDSKEIEKEIAPYKAGRGTLKFPLDKELPLPLVRKVVKLLLQANRERTVK